MSQLLSTDPQFAVPPESIGPVCEEHPPAGGLAFRWISSVDELEEILPQWIDLADHAVWRNAMFEHSFLIPALKFLNKGNVRVLVVESHDPMPVRGGTQLVALLPVVKKRFYHLPVSCLEVWKHDQCFDTTPLIRKTGARQTLDSILDFFSWQKIGLLSLDTVSAEPEFQAVLNDAIARKGRSLFHRDSFIRSALRPEHDSDEYLRKFVSKNLRKKNRRLARRLCRLGKVTCELSSEFSDYEALTQQFLEIESCGWKAKTGTALNCHPHTRYFYEELISRSAQYGNARFLSLKLDGNPVIMLSDIQSGKKVFSFKTGYDERFAAFSPGLQIEMKNIQSLHDSGIELVDSCMQPGNTHLNRTWGQTLHFQSAVIGLRPGMPSLATQLMPWIQSAANQFKRIRS